LEQTSACHLKLNSRRSITCRSARVNVSSNTKKGLFIKMGKENGEVASENARSLNS